MSTRTVLWLCVNITCLSLLSTSAFSEEFKYTGVRDCSRCHKKELIGNQTKTWKESKHAQAFKTLKSDEAVKVAKELGIAGPPHEAGECLRCHATAHGIPPEKVEKRPLRLQDGVQCESCHGPGSAYKGNEVMSDHDQSVAAGMWEPGKDEKICRACHNEESPSYVEFDYEKRKEEIAHHIPENVKGHYLELELEEKKNMRKRRE